MLPEGTVDLIDRALAEDLGEGDHTTRATIPSGVHGAARLLVKQDGVLAGVELAEAIVRRHAPGLTLKTYLLDGAAVKAGDIAFTLLGDQRGILEVERLVLNFMQRMSGIATRTRQYVDAVADTRCRILDTRKTTPGLRAIEKWAVRIGGGLNHRMGLYDMLMIKDNHADFAGGITPAISSARSYLKEQGLDLPIEVETRSLEEVEEVLAAGGVQRIMLDNFDPHTLRQAVERIGHRYETEASGGIILSTIREYAGTGVDFISVGALTHSIESLDLSLKAV